MPVDIEPPIRRELTQRLAAGFNLPQAERLGVGLESVRAAVEGGDTVDAHAAAVVTAFARPVVAIDVTLGTAESRSWSRMLLIARRELLHAASLVGRVRVDGHPAWRWAGTCWFVAETIAVTTRSIAAECRYRGVHAFVERNGRSVRVVDVRMDESAPESPIAFLVVDARQPGIALRPPPAAMAPGESVAVITYCARDSRSRQPINDEAYAATFNQKGVAPGRLILADASHLTHDCGSVGASSGGLIMHLATGGIVGLHVAGGLDGPGFGAPWSAIDRAARAAGHAIAIAAPAPDEDALERRRPTAEDYAGRKGYQEDFLGIRVPPPEPKAPVRSDVLRFAVDGADTTLLPYTHFSVCMSRDRRLCRFTACNVEGGSLEALARAGIPWRFDPRVDEEQQAGNELYVDNDLDRGHMVRRLDPVWGDDAEQANEDTFHYTNSCPQHKDLNQKIWNDLEDYVLDNAGKHELKINVFTGPVLRADDPPYRDFHLPLDFWKVVVMVKDDGTLSATAYTLTQRDLVTGLEFLFGEFRTYQVPLRQIEEWTDLDFGELRNFDPKGALEGAEAVVEITRPGDIQL
jgi:endonuclease G